VQRGEGGGLHQVAGHSRVLGPVATGRDAAWARAL